VEDKLNEKRRKRIRWDKKVFNRMKSIFTKNIFVVLTKIIVKIER